MRTLASLGCALLLAAAPAFGQNQRPYPANNGWAYQNGSPGRWDQSWNNRPNPRAGVCFYTDRNFQGNRFCVRANDRLRSLPGNFGDNISSMQVFGRGRVRVFEDRDFRGHRFVFNQSVADLRQVPSKPGHTWNNRISSVVVQ